MSFSATELANMACREIPTRQIVSLEDNTQTATVMRAEIPQVLGEIMESGEWSFGVRRETLSATTNTRTSAWAYAFAVPTGMAMPLRIVPTPDVTDATFLLPGQRLVANNPNAGPPIPFDFEGPLLWTDEPAPILEFITVSPEWNQMSYRFRRVLALTVAARSVVAITQNTERKRELLQEAELFGQRALAASLNANSTQNTYGEDFIPSSLRGHFEANE